MSALVIICFILFFILVGLSVDYAYLNSFWSHSAPIPIATLAGFYPGADWVLASVGAEPLDGENPEHRELRNLVTEMALASGCPMPKVLVTYDSAPNAFATGRDEQSSVICVTTGLPAVYQNPKSWIVTGTEGIFAYPRGEETENVVEKSVSAAGKVILQSLLRLALGI